MERKSRCEGTMQYCCVEFSWDYDTKNANVHEALSRLRNHLDIGK